MTTVRTDPPTTSEQGYTQPFDVVVLGTAGICYGVTDALRDTGLKVGSWLLPSEASAAGARLRIRNALSDRNSTVARWRRAPIVSLFRDPLISADIETAVRGVLPVPPPGWLQLTPHAISVPGDPPAVRAPMKINIMEDKVYAPVYTRLTLLRQAELQRGTPQAPYGRAVRALLDSIPKAFAEPPFDKFPYVLAGQP